MNKVWALFAPGESLTAEQCEKARPHCSTMVISDAFKLAPWADVLVANDGKWWEHRPEAALFAGKRFTANPNVKCAKQVADYDCLINRISNSGVLGIYVARNFGAKRILLIGFDMHGTHFFGPHKDGLKNTTPERFKVFQTYFKAMGELLKKEKVEVFNCTEGSALDCFPRLSLEEALCLPPL